MRNRSRAAVMVAIILAFSMVGFPGLVVQGLPPGYPVVVSLRGVDRVFFATHTSSKVDGNWIELSGGTTVEIPKLGFVYEGPPTLSYPIGEITVKIDPGFIQGLTYPLSTHQVYKKGQSVSAKFWGSTDFASESVDFILLRVSSLSEIIDVLNEGSLGNILTLLNSLVEWDTVPLNSYGDGTYSFTAPAAGDYLLVVAKLDFSDLKFYLYSATAIEVVDDTLGVTAPLSVKKGDPVYVNSKLASAPAGSYTHVAAMIKKLAYSGDIKLKTDGTVPKTEIYVNGELMADGSLFTDFFLGNKDQSDITIELIKEKLMKAFDPDELAFGYTTATHTGSMSLSTSSLATGDYFLLVGVWKDFETRIVGLKQTTVTVSAPPSPPPPPPPPSPQPNKKPKADAGPNMKISVGSTLYFSGADSYDPDGTIVAYSWDFGDGTTATGVEVHHTYSEPGHYTATLTVKDNLGAEDSDKCKVFVWKPPAPVADRFGQLVPGEQKGFKVNAEEAAKTTVTLNTKKPVTVTVLKYEENPHPDDPMPANALQIYVDVEVSNSTAVEWPIYVEVHYTDEEAEGLDEDSLGIYYWMDGAWHRCSDTGVYPDRNVVWAHMTEEEASGSPILVGYTPPRPAEFTVSNLTITPTVIHPGEEVTISVLISNIGEEPGNYTISLYVGLYSVLGDTYNVYEEEVTLDGGASETVSYTLTPDLGGTYAIEVDGLTGSFEVKSTPKPRPAEFVVSDLVISPSEVLEGEEVTVSVTITNIGEIMGTHTLEIRIAGKPEGPPIETTLIGGTFTTATIKVIKPLGDYPVEVDGLVGSFKVLPKPFWRNPYYIAGMLILIAAVVTLYILYIRGLLPIHKLPKQ